MVFHPVLINKYKVNLGSKVNNKQAGGTLYDFADFNFFSILFIEQLIPPQKDILL